MIVRGDLTVYISILRVISICITLAGPIKVVIASVNDTPSCYSSIFAQYEEQSEGQVNGVAFESRGGSAEAEIFSKPFNFTACLGTCKRQTFKYMVVLYHYTPDTFKCKCGDDLPTTSETVGANVKFYCGYQCTSNPEHWCIEKNRDPLRSRGQLYVVEYQTVTTRAATTSTTSTSLSKGIITTTQKATHSDSDDARTTFHTTRGASSVNMTDQVPSGLAGLSPPVLAGIVVGIIAFLGLIAVVIIIIVIRKRRQKKPDKEPSDLPYDPVQNFYDSAEIVDDRSEEVQPYEEWTVEEKQSTPPASDKIPKSQPPDGNTTSSNPGSVEEVYAVPDKNKKPKLTKQESESVEIVDNDVYGEEFGNNEGANAADKKEDATYYNTSGTFQTE